MSVPDIRVRALNDAPVRSEGDFVLYWMIAYRRTTWNFSLQRAVEWAHDLRKPLVVFEALRCDYRWASDRLHRFVLDGMADNARSFHRTNAHYYPYVEPHPGAGKGLLNALAARACVVITDEFPAFFLPQMVAVAARHLPVLLEQVDSNGLLPLRAVTRIFKTAYSFRRFLQENLPSHVIEAPQVDPLRAVELPRLPGLPDGVAHRWRKATGEMLSGAPEALAKLPVNHSVGVVGTRGGAKMASDALGRFLDDRLPHYHEGRNQPEADVSSGLSPYLHFGHISTHQVFAQLAERERWSIARLAPRATGSRSGWWGMSPAAEGFLDQLITWRELGFNMCWQRGDYDRYESLPEWAQETLAKHVGDPRPRIYSLDEFEAGRTHDPLWNAAQGQLLREGRIHNYLRMLWGKKILEWTVSPQEALEVMTELNNKYALDGRDPNSYSGIFWVLGRYDRPWGPERPVFGKVRYMSSESTLRKVDAREYVRRYSP
jgi:deoxyribodipyrimidine photo-lyase